MSIWALSVHFDAHTMWVEFSDGRTIGIPLAGFPRLLHATSEQRRRVQLSRLGLHWDEIDEDISIAGLLEGRDAVIGAAERPAEHSERAGILRQPICGARDLLPPERDATRRESSELIVNNNAGPT